MTEKEEFQFIADNLRRNAKAKGQTLEQIRQTLELKRLQRWEIDTIMRLIEAKW